jgi:hypothetical protein
MKKVLDFIKMVFAVCKNWIVSNGVEGILGLLIGLVLWAMGYKIWAGFSFGVRICLLGFCLLYLLKRIFYA